MDAVELGRFIAFEGGEGAGKSTQARLLAEALEARGIHCVLTREPGGTPGAEAIRTLLLDPPSDPSPDGDAKADRGWGPEAEALLFAAARADHVARLILPSLKAGAWVVSDRFLDSSRAYQGAAGEVGDGTVHALHAIGSGGLLPDLTIVIDAGSHTAERLRARDGDRADAIGGRDEAYHASVNAAFREFAAREPERFVLIDGSGTPEEVHAWVMAAIAPLC